jgi:ATP synthase F1 delta subunit
MSSTKFSRRILARTVAAKLLAEPSRQDYWIRALAAYLVAQHREQEADLISNDLAHELYEQNGQLLVDVVSARPLTDEVRSSLKALLSRETKATNIELTEQVDPALLGGLIARTPDATLDVSVRSKIKELATIK